MRLILVFCSFVIPAIAWLHADAETVESALGSNEYTLLAFTHATHNITSFPTIRLYRHTSLHARYRGPRKHHALSTFFQRMQHPPIVPITAANASALLTADDILIIAYIPSSHSTLRARFEQAANKYHDRYTFALSLDTASNQVPTLLCYNLPDEIERSTEELDKAGAIDIFIKTCATPLIDELTRRNEMGYYQSGKSIVHYFTSTSSDRRSYIQQILPLAKKYNEYLHFTTTDINEYPDSPAMMGLKRGARGLSVQNPSNGDVFPYTGRDEISAGVVEAFLVDIIQGRVRPWGRGRRNHEEL
ncbi:hypothetical protein OQA88_8324 [Cercophora sp. LCS_1]